MLDHKEEASGNVLLRDRGEKARHRKGEGSDERGRESVLMVQSKNTQIQGEEGKKKWQQRGRKKKADG